MLHSVRLGIFFWYCVLNQQPAAGIRKQSFNLQNVRALLAWAVGLLSVGLAR